MSAVPRGNSGAAIGIAFTALTFLTLIARLFTRFHLVKNAGPEEIVIVFSWVRDAVSMDLGSWLYTFEEDFVTGDDGF